jgi:hypothetical protein
VSSDRAADGSRWVDFLVDLATRTTLLQSAARRFGISPDNRRSLDRVAVLGDGQTPVTLAGTGQHVPSQLAVHDLPLRVRGTVPDLGGPDAVAVPGMDLLGSFDVEFDPAHKVLNLFKSAGCKKALLAYWDKQASRVEMLADIYDHHINETF